MGSTPALPRATELPSGSTAARVEDDETPTRLLADQVAELERQAIASALRQAKGNRALVARRLGMSRAALYDRLARWPELQQLG